MTTDYIFLIDDDEQIRLPLSYALHKQGYEVQQAASGKEGLHHLRERIPDLLVLDIMMPLMSGIEVCQYLRSDPIYNRLPILFLSGLNTTDEIIEGLDAGGDDYIVKPFEITELTARVRALLRRSQRDAQTDEQRFLRLGDLALDNHTFQVMRGNETIQLTVTEYRLLKYLMEHPKQATRPEVLLQSVWGYPSDIGDVDLVRAHIRNLRAKIEWDSKSPLYVKTIHGIGYMIYDPNQDLN